MMVPDPSSQHAATPSELEERLRVERQGSPFLALRDGDGHQRLLVLDAEREAVSVGRGEQVDLRLDWDGGVSRLHAELELRAGEWTLVDDGLSRNGSFVGGERLSGRRRLRDGDVLRFGETLVTFRAPRQGGSTATVVAEDLMTAARLSDSQRRVLFALCRPFKDAPTFARPPTNQQIADELVLSVEGVKTHLRALFAKFGVEELPQSQKRLRLVERAFQTGIVSERDL